MKTVELRGKSRSELDRLLQETERRLANLRMEVAARKIKTVADIRKARREAARLRTLIREQEITAGRPGNEDLSSEALSKEEDHA